MVNPRNHVSFAGDRQHLYEIWLDPESSPLWRRDQQLVAPDAGLVCGTRHIPMRGVDHVRIEGENDERGDALDACSIAAGAADRALEDVSTING